MNIHELKHGEIDVKILICNKAYQSALVKTSKDVDDSDFEGELKNFAYSRLLVNYLFQCYVAYCQEKEISKKWGVISFQEELIREDVDLDASTRDKCFEAISESITSKFTEMIETATKKKQIETIVEQPLTT